MTVESGMLIQIIWMELARIEETGNGEIESDLSSSLESGTGPGISKTH